MSCTVLNCLLTPEFVEVEPETVAHDRRHRRLAASAKSADNRRVCRRRAAAPSWNVKSEMNTSPLNCPLSYWIDAGARPVRSLLRLKLSVPKVKLRELMAGMSALSGKLEKGTLAKPELVPGTN